jgi:hypothetical protein
MQIEAGSLMSGWIATFTWYVILPQRLIYVAIEKYLIFFFSKAFRNLL